MLPPDFGKFVIKTLMSCPPPPRFSNIKLILLRAPPEFQTFLVPAYEPDSWLSSNGKTCNSLCSYVCEITRIFHQFQGITLIIKKDLNTLQANKIDSLVSQSAACLPRYRYTKYLSLADQSCLITIRLEAVIFCEIQIQGVPQ